MPIKELNKNVRESEKKKRNLLSSSR